MRHDYLSKLPGDKTYVTIYRLFITAVQASECPSADLQTLEYARHITAYRRDGLVGRQRRKWSSFRQVEIDALADVYDSLNVRSISMRNNA